MLSTHGGNEALRVELSCLGGALHIRRRYWRFVFGSIETTTIDMQNQDKCRCNSTGCVYQTP